MTHLTRSLFIMLLALTMACEQTSESTEEQSEVTEAQTDKTVEKVTSVDLLNVNLATVEELSLAGLSQDQINEIIESRPFLDMMDFHNLLSREIDSTRLAALYGKVFVPFNINTTPEENFKIIPGVGDRMAHEFEEYRPYTKIQQFRHEIGKYVDEAEVARLEQYIFVPVELNSATKEDILALPGVGERMAHEFEEYRPYKNMEQFRKEIGKYVDDKELARLERLVYLKDQNQ